MPGISAGTALVPAEQGAREQRGFCIQQLSPCLLWEVLSLPGDLLASVCIAQAWLCSLEQQGWGGCRAVSPRLKPGCRLWGLSTFPVFPIPTGCLSEPSLLLLWAPLALAEPPASRAA